MRRLAAIIMILGSVLGITTAAAAPATHASVIAPAAAVRTLGDRVLDKAETRTGDWYSYGAAGPAYFDCSGLIVWAAGQLGITLPHSTYSMLAGTSHLYRIPLSQARRGDLLFYNSGHVELDTIWYHTSFGAQHTGTRVGWHRWSGWWAPTMAMRLR